MTIRYDGPVVPILVELLEDSRPTRRYAAAMDAIEAMIRRDGLTVGNHVGEGMHRFATDALSFTVVQSGEDVLIVGVAYSLV